MKRSIIAAAAALAVLAACSPRIDLAGIAEAGPGQISRVEPPCWWTGMKTELQLLVQGPGIGSYEVCAAGLEGVRVTGTHQAESPNYIFVDLAVGAETGTAWLVFSREGESFKVPYEIAPRRKGSAMRGSFTTADAIYLIMPDRFSNGDPSNDNTGDTTEKADYEAFFGRHGGDIRGIRNHLDYIADLGMTAIWCTPLLEDNVDRESYHGYACTDYYNIDSRFGSNADYRELVADAHAHGIKMIMDVVTNHCGDRHWWMADLPFADWVHQWPEYTHSNCSFSVQNDPYVSQKDRKNMEEGWFDRAMVDMNLDNPYTLKYFQQWAVWWTEWADLDGFRVDTYPYNEKVPMSKWCKAVRAEYPNLNIVGEVWSVNVPQVAYWQTGNHNPDGFDSNLPSIMDFCLHSAICQSINTDFENWDEGITKVYDSMANDVYLHDTDNIMIFPGNHDTARIADVAQGDPRKVKMVMAMMATLRGFPQIFAGDELFCRSRDLSQGHGGLRVEFPEDWESDAVRKDVHDYFRTIFNWRKNSDAVQHGRTMHFISRTNTYAYFRYTATEAVFVFVNNRGTAAIVPWEDYAEITCNIPSNAFDVVTGEAVSDLATMEVAPKSALILEFRK